eukprot:6204101-Pleurochrysis_carterae.AAC.1
MVKGRQLERKPRNEIESTTTRKRNETLAASSAEAGESEDSARALAASRAHEGVPRHVCARALAASDAQERVPRHVCARALAAAPRSRSRRLAPRCLSSCSVLRILGFFSGFALSLYSGL